MHSRRTRARKHNLGSHAVSSNSPAGCWSAPARGTSAARRPAAACRASGASARDASGHRAGDARTHGDQHLSQPRRRGADGVHRATARGRQECPPRRPVRSAIRRAVARRELEANRTFATERTRSSRRRREPPPPGARIRSQGAARRGEESTSASASRILPLPMHSDYFVMTAGIGRLEERGPRYLRVGADTVRVERCLF